MTPELTIDDIHQSFENGSSSAVQITQHYLKQIQASDLGAVIFVNPSALDEAKQLDDNWASNKKGGPLHGIPVLLKDNINVAGMPTTAGSKLLANYIPEVDANLVTHLKRAGAIILGKANLSEWANFRSNRSSSGWSSVGGQTRNPYDPSRSTSGSSSGSAAAVAANLTCVAVGTETDGSVICPAALTGIVGFKPTLGRIPADGIVPIAHSQDTAGPMARTVTDTVRLFDVMANTTFFESLSQVDLSDLTFAVVENLTGYHPATDAVFNDQIKLLEAAGAKIRFTRLPKDREIGRFEYQVLLSEFKHDIAEFLKSTNLPYRSLKDLIDANEADPDILQHFDQSTFLAAQAAKGLDDPEYLEALQMSKQLSGPEGIDKSLNETEADFLIAPSMAPAWKIDYVLGDHSLGGATTAAAVAGYPHITVPMGFVKHLPVGLSMIGKHNDDARVLSAAHLYEQISKARRPPNR